MVIGLVIKIQCTLVIQNGNKKVISNEVSFFIGKENLLEKHYVTPEIEVTIFESDVKTTEIDGEGNIITKPLTGSEPEMTTLPDFMW